MTSVHFVLETSFKWLCSPVGVMIVVVVDPFEEHPGGGRGAAELKINIKLLYFRSTQVFDDRIK